MSVLHKLEESYLAILRFVVITIASLLLVVAVLFAVSAINGIWGKESSIQPSSKVSPNDIVLDITKAPERPHESRQEAQGNKSKSPDVQNNADYQRSVNLIVAFVSKHGRGLQGVDPDKAMRIIKQRAEDQPTADLTKSFASGLAETFEKVLGDQKVIALVSRPIWDDEAGARQAEVGISPATVVDMVLGQYAMRFNQQVMRAKADEEKSKAERAAKKEEAMFRLYAAAGIFCVFLMLVFLSIIIRIERNLRPLSYLGKEASE